MKNYEVASKLSLGESVKIKSVGWSYPSYDCERVKSYIRRYKPINASIEKYGLFVHSGYDTAKSLDKREDLKWKVRSIINIGNEKLSSKKPYLYIVSSNLNHMLVIAYEGISKIKK